MRQIAHVVFAASAALGLLAFVFWGVAIVKGSGTLGWLGALVIVLAIVMSFVGAGLIDTAQKRENR